MKKTFYRFLLSVLCLMLCCGSLAVETSAAEPEMWINQVALSLDTADTNVTPSSLYGEDDCLWYTRSTGQVNFDITTEKQLASVAKLVNEGYWQRTEVTSEKYSESDGKAWNKNAASDYYYTDSQSGNEYRYNTENENTYIRVYPDFKDKVLYIAKDLDLKGSLWVPIGTEEHPFRGAIQGKSKGGGTFPKIKGMNVTADSAVVGENCAYYGLFGVVDSEASLKIKDNSVTNLETPLTATQSAEINCLTVSGTIDITGTQNAAAGAFAAKITGAEAKLSNLTSNVAIESSTKRTVSIGGLVGDAQGAVVVNCVNHGMLTVTEAAQADVGGLFGIAKDAVFTVNGGDGYSGNETVVSSGADYTNIDVKAVNANVGGIIGSLPATYGIRYIEKSGDTDIKVYQKTNTLQVSAAAKGKSDWPDNNAEYLVSLGDISVNASASANVGGFIGRSDIVFTLDKASFIRNITVEGTASGARVGGILGGQYGAEKTMTLTNCSLTTAILLKDSLGNTMLEKTSDKAEISVVTEGNCDVGGLVGYADNLAVEAPFVGGKPENADAAVTITANSTSTKAGTVGGIAGKVVSGALCTTDANKAKTLRLTIDAKNLTSVGGFLGDAKLTEDFYAAWDDEKAETELVTVSAVDCEAVGGFIGTNQKVDGNHVLNLSAKLVNLTAKNPTRGGCIGGFIGVNKQNYDNTTLKISDCETKMTVSGSECCVGGVVGQNEAELDGKWDRNNPKNRILVNNITITTSVTDSYVGGVAGYLKSGSIKGVEAKNLKITDNITDSENKNQIGGLVGRAEQVISNIALSDLTIMLNGDKNIVGGAVGVYTSPAETPSNVTILSSTINNSGNVDGVVIGGFAGENTVTIKNLSTADGLTIQLGSAVDAVVGGLVGRNSGTLDAVTTSAAITGISKASGFRIGGLVGENTVIGKISNSSRERDISLKGNAVSTDRSVLGGLAGWNAGTVERSFAACSLSTGKLGNVYVGGLVGEMTGGAVLNCYVAAYKTLTAEASDTYLGGFLGWYIYGKVTNCYSAAEVVGAASQTAGMASDNAGGFIAYYNADSKLLNFNADFFAQQQQGGINSGFNSGLQIAAGGKYRTFEDCAENLRAITLGELSEQSGIPFRTYLNDQGAEWNFNSVWCYDAADKAEVGYIYPFLRMQRDDNSVNGRFNLNWYTSVPENKGEYHLKTEADMTGFAALVSGHVMGLNAVDFAGATVYLDNPISMQTVNWSAVGDDSRTPFNGTFDGQNKLISGFVDEAEDAAGLFGHTGSAAVIKNVSMSVSSVTSTNGAAAALVAYNDGSIENAVVVLENGASVQGKTHAGVIVGKSTGDIQNVKVTGEDVSITAEKYAGGVAGETSGSIGNAVVELIGGMIGFETCEYAGGIAGKAAAVNAETVTVTANVKGDTNKNETYVGSIVGSGASVTFTTAVVEGDITGTEYVGGIAGNLTGDIVGQANENVEISTVTVTANISGTENVGGIVGSGASVNIETAEVTGDIFGKGNVGGIAGKLSGGIEADTLTVTAETNGIGEGIYTGGIVGQAGDEVKIGTVTVKANVSGDTTNDSTYVGGIVGSGVSVNIETAEVTGDIIGTGFVGGIAGNLDGGIEADTLTVTAKNGISNGTHVGGIVGNGTVVNVTVKAVITGDITGTTYVGGIAGNGTTITMPEVTIEGNVKGADNVGGVVGSGVSVTFTTAVVEGDITGTEYVGGIAGNLTGDIVGQANENVEISTVTVTANISGTENVGGIVGSGASVNIETAEVTGDIFGKGNVGGIAGKLSGGIEADTLTVTAETNGIGEGDYVGGIVGQAGDAIKIGTVTVTANVKGDTNKNETYVGSIVGSGASVTFTTAVVEGDITGTEYVGGIAGNLTGDIVGQANEDVEISTVTVTSNIIGSDNVGGIVGSGKSVSVSAAEITGDITGTGFVGGIAGKLSGGIEAETLTVTAENGISNGTHVGGIVGQARDDLEIGTVTVTANVSGDTTNDTTYVGGIVGEGTSVTVTAAEVTGDITGTEYVGGIAGKIGSVNDTELSFIGTVTGSTYTGGIAGQLTDSISNVTLTGAGTLTGTGSAKVVGKDYVGGAIGLYSRAALDDVITLTELTVKNIDVSNAKVTVDSYLGGLVGRLEKAILTDSSLENVKVTASGDSKDVYLGGIAGQVTDSIISGVTGNQLVVRADGCKGNVYSGGAVGSLTVTTDKNKTWLLTDEAVLGAYQGIDNVSFTDVTVTVDSALKETEATHYLANKKAYVGGLVGYLSGGSVYNSTVTRGTAAGTGYCNLYVSGAVGQAKNAYLVNNTVDCGETAANAFKLYAGGFVGEMVNTTARYNKVEAAGANKLTVTETVGVSKSPILYVGGFAGNILGTTADQIRDNHAKTDINVSNEHVSTSIYVGGFAGLAGRDEKAVEMTVCTAESNITVCSENSGSPSGSGSYAGGFIGQLYTGTIDSCYALSNVNENKCTTARSGGFAGSIHNQASSVPSSVQNCYVVGDMVAVHGNTTTYCGGFVGECEGTLSMVYADVKTKQGDSQYVGDIVGVLRNNANVTYAYSTGLTSKTLLEGFDFTTENSKWVYQNGVNGNRPVLTAFASWDSDPDIGYLYRHAVNDMTVADTAELGTVMALLNDNTIYKLFSDGRKEVQPNVMLTKDLSLESSKVWKLKIPVKSVFDGQGHTLSNLKCELPGASVACGFVIENAGTLINLTLDKAKVVGNGTVGAAVGKNIGTVEQVIVMNADLSAKSCVGAVVGENTGNISQSIVFGEYLIQPPKPDKFIMGGIVGTNSGTVIKCMDAANIRIAGCIANLGGIAGESSGSIENCMTASGSLVSSVYGTTASGGNVGGIVGLLKTSGTVKDSISLSQVILLDKDGNDAKNAGAAIGKKDAGTVENVYNVYYDKRVSRAADLTSAFKKDTSEMLGVKVVDTDAFTEQSGLYPILTWMTESSSRIQNIGKLSTAAFKFDGTETVAAIHTAFPVSAAHGVALKDGENTSVFYDYVTLKAKEGTLVLSSGDLTRTIKLSNKDYTEKPSGGTGGGGGGTGGGLPIIYTVTVPKTVLNGTIEADKITALAGETVTITVTPDEGMHLGTLIIANKNGREFEYTDLGDGKYSFKMPTGSVTVKVEFTEGEAVKNFFVDVPADAYFYDAVQWAAENGITVGIDDKHFAPEFDTTRAQVVTFLWRAAGCPEPTDPDVKFTDVPADEFYAKAVAWAVEKGITKGTSDTTFEPEMVCTRAQIVTFLARFAGVEDTDTTSVFSDVASIDYYAAAVKWAKDNGVTAGTSATTFSPSNNCTRAQVVTFLYRWMTK